MKQFDIFAALDFEPQTADIKAGTEPATNDTTADETTATEDDSTADEAEKVIQFPGSPTPEPDDESKALCVGMILEDTHGKRHTITALDDMKVEFDNGKRSLIDFGASRTVADAISAIYGGKLVYNPAEAEPEHETEPTEAETKAEPETDSTPEEPTTEEEHAAAEPAPVKYYEINEKLAEQSQQMWSMRDYVKGSATAEYRSYVDKCHEEAEKHKKRVDPMYHAQIDKLVDTYARKLAANMNKGYSIEMQCPSVLVAGPANFPTKKKERQNAARDNNMKEWREIQDMIRKIKSVGTGGVSSDDPDAIKKIQAKIDERVKLQERMKKVNAFYRKHKTVKGCPDLTPQQIEKLMNDKETSWRGEHWRPFAEYQLSNNNAEINRLKKRIKSLEAKESHDFWEGEIDGVRVEADRDDNRYKLYFEGKPDEEMRSKLRSNGFKWSPKNQCWQRQLNANAEHAITHSIFNIE